MDRAPFEEQSENSAAGIASDHRIPDGPAFLNSLHADPVTKPALMTDGTNSIHPQEEQLNKIKQVPKEVGVMLITAGIVGFILPGPGTPAIIAGGLALWPGAFGKLESWLQRRNPGLHRKGVQQINRFLDDLEKRYPNSTPLGE
jgi:hypothetical protein